jgi:hypothetical protein
VKLLLGARFGRVRSVEIVSQEDQKDRRREMGVSRCRRRFGAALRAEWRGEQSNL